MFRKSLAGLCAAVSLLPLTAAAQVTQTGDVRNAAGQSLPLTPETIFVQSCNGGLGGIVGQAACQLPTSGGGGGSSTITNFPNPADTNSGAPGASTIRFVPATGATPCGSTPVAPSQMGLAITTSTALTVPATATCGVITVVVGCANNRDDGTAPTGSAGGGEPLCPGSQLILLGASLAADRFIQQSAGSLLNVKYYRAP